MFLEIIKINTNKREIEWMIPENVSIKFRRIWNNQELYKKI